MSGKRDLYREAGVNVDLGNALAKRYGQIAAGTMRPGVAAGIGGFAGGFRLDLQRYPKPLLVSGTDGVGTKLAVAQATGRHSTIGIDCVAMCVNDILCLGAEPLFFLDYLATGKLDADAAEAVVAGIAEGCKEAGCALVGGETAEMPGMYPAGAYDIAGFAVGVVNEDAVVDGARIERGDVVLGLASNGLHSNGFSLVRRLVEQAGLRWEARLPGWRGSVADELLRPTRIYVHSILSALQAGLPIKGMAHITGGGLVDNLPRCLPQGLQARLSFDAWERHAVFDWLMRQGGMSLAAAARVWNLGIGFTVVVAPQEAQRVADFLTDLGESVVPIGRIEASPSAAAAPAVVWEAEG
jgi:phosphoribosylformylglycinamidine cyclo-ligase